VPSDSSLNRHKDVLTYLDSRREDAVGPCLLALDDIIVRRAVLFWNRQDAEVHRLLDVADFAQEGRRVLARALASFDPDRGCTLTAWATGKLRTTFLDVLRQHHLLDRAGPNRSSVTFEMNAMEEDGADGRPFVPSFLVCPRLGPAEIAVAAEDSGRRHNPNGDLYANWLIAKLDTIPAKHRRVARLYWLEKQGLYAIAAELNLSSFQEARRRVHAAAPHFQRLIARATGCTTPLPLPASNAPKNNIGGAVRWEGRRAA
jgi:RNA polymerase sigma factor (sigma-70 family)